MNNQRTQLLYLAATLVVGVLFWSSAIRFYFSNPPNPGISSSYQDKLSGQEVTTEQINNVTHTNPRAPYFVAFDKLAYYGVSSDDVRYIQDFIINFSLYNEQLDAPIVSLVDNSFKGPFIESEGFVTKYSFDFGIDGGNVHTVSVISNSKDPSIDIKILQNGAVVDHRKFTLYYL